MNIDEINEFSDKMVAKGLFYIKKRDIHDAGENIYDKTAFGQWVWDKGYTDLVVLDEFTVEDVNRLKRYLKRRMRNE